jgi:hypothetical protein
MPPIREMPGSNLGADILIDIIPGVPQPSLENSATVVPI